MSAPDELGQDYLEVRGLTVEFDGFKAVDGVDLTLLQGRLHFLIGPNGAGKTTLVDALTGLVPAPAWRATATATCSLKSHQIVRAGIGRTFQTATVFEELTVLQNLDIAGGVHRRAWRMLLRPARRPDYVEQALETIGLTALRDRPAGVLAHGQKQWLEIGMLLVQDAKVMFLDETVAGHERTRSATRPASCSGASAPSARSWSSSTTWTSSARFADVVTVMHAGKVLTEGTVAEIQADRAGPGGLPRPRSRRHDWHAGVRGA